VPIFRRSRALPVKLVSLAPIVKLFIDDATDSHPRTPKMLVTE
jgi:hypothetical protein